MKGALSDKKVPTRCHLIFSSRIDEILSDLAR